MMETLYPIIRRVRRPLLVEDAPPVMVGNVEPVQPIAALPEVEPPAANESAQSSDEEVSTQSDAR